MTATAPETERTGTVLHHDPQGAPGARDPHQAQRRHDLGTVDLEPTVFGLEPNRAVLHQVVTASAGRRPGRTQSTKTRAEVRGGGAKPFRQEGYGPARQGSSRSPSMIGGGVALGPKPRSYVQRTLQDGPPGPALGAERSGRHRAHRGRRRLEDHGAQDEDAATIVRKLRLTGSLLVVVGQDELDVERLFANLPQVHTTTFGEPRPTTCCARSFVFSDRTPPAAASTSPGRTWWRRPPSPGPSPRPNLTTSNEESGEEADRDA